MRDLIKIMHSVSIKALIRFMQLLISIHGQMENNSTNSVKRQVFHVKNYIQLTLRMECVMEYSHQRIYY